MKKNKINLKQNGPKTFSHDYLIHIFRYIRPNFATIRWLLVEDRTGSHSNTCRRVSSNKRGNFDSRTPRTRNLLDEIPVEKGPFPSRKLYSFVSRRRKEGRTFVLDRTYNFLCGRRKKMIEDGGASFSGCNRDLISIKCSEN